MMTRVERINSGVNACSDVFTHFVATWAVPAADLTVAVLAASNMANVLGFSWPVAILTGFALEGVGIASSKAALECHYYNQVRNDKPPVLEWLAWTVAGVQFLVGFALILVNAVLIDRMVLGLLSIGVLSATGTLAHMLRDDVRARSNSADALPSPERVEQVIAEIAPAADEMTPRARVLSFYALHGDATQQAAASACGISRPRVGQLLAELEREGAISRNGEVKVLA